MTAPTWLLNNQQVRYASAMDSATTEQTTTNPPDEATSPIERTPEEEKAYNQAKRRVHILDIGISLTYWLIWCGLAAGFVSWLDLSIDSRWLALLAGGSVMFIGSTLVNLPLDFYSSFTLEQRFNLSNQTPLSWLWFQVKTWLVGGILGGAVLAGLYAALWYTGSLWSFWLWLGLMFLAIVLAKVFPLLILPIFYKSTPLDRPALAERLEKLAGHTGMTITGIFNLGLSKDTKKANAMLTGLGSTRRVYLSDTLLEAFSDDQIAVVFAHELGHHVRKHIYKAILMSAVVTSLLVALIHWRLNPFAGTELHWSGAMIALPQVLLIVSAVPLVSSIVTNALSRHFERQCDMDALQMTDDPEAYRSTFELLADMNLADRAPPRWEVILFADHPPINERIAMTDKYVNSSDA